MRIFIPVLLLTAFITSCSGGDEKDIDPMTGLTKEDYAQAKLINDAIEDVRTAVNIGMNRLTPEGGPPSEKAIELSKGINKSNCNLTEYEPADRYDTDWGGEKSATGTSCPLRAIQKWNFKNSTRRLEFSEQFAAQSEDFKKKSVAESFAIEKGYIDGDSTDSAQRVYGRASFSNIYIQGVGLVAAELTASQEGVSGRTKGQMLFELQSRAKLYVRVDVTWFTGRPPQYRINGTTVTETVAQELFSAFGLKEMIDRLAKVRY